MTACGIPRRTLIAATTNDPTAPARSRDLQAALRAATPKPTGSTVVKPINDTMRELQRDALVAYVLHQLRRESRRTAHDRHAGQAVRVLPDGRADGAVHADLADPARALVGAAVHRALPAATWSRGVAPSDINAAQWEWMKRYRVWQANREVFLWPENWLEPELRDDQSPFFKELDERAAAERHHRRRGRRRYLNYLAKLEEVAKLEPCGMSLRRDDPNGRRDRPRRRAHRRGPPQVLLPPARGGYWTPGRRSSSTSRTTR